MQIIAFNGFKQSGKGTSANIAQSLFEDQGLTVKQVGFADKLKIAAAAALGYDAPDDERIAFMDQFKLTGRIDSWASLNEVNAFRFKQAASAISGREYLQRFGTEVGRDIFGESFWVDQVLPPEDLTYEAQQAGLSARYPGVDVLLITDLRFPNEAARVRECRGDVVEVVRPGTGGDGHSSEVPLPEHLITARIYNTNDVDFLVDEVAATLQAIA